MKKKKSDEAKPGVIVTVGDARKVVKSIKKQIKKANPDAKPTYLVIPKVTDEEKKKHEEAIEAAGKVQILFGFCATLIPHLEILKETGAYASDRISRVQSAAPIIMAMGGNYEEKEFEATLHAKRARALITLIETLKETEDEREEFKNKQAAKEKGRADLSRLFGL